MPLSALIYDFDYTLADSSAGIVECVRHAFTCLRLPAPEAEAICRTIGRSLPDTFRALSDGAVPSASVPELEAEFLRLFIARADEIMVERTVLLPGARETLETLRLRGLRQAIVTTKFRRRIEAVLAREGCRETIDVIVGGDDVAEPKPAPEGLRLALRLLAVDAAACYYVGDSLVDAAAASAAGVPFIAVATGPTPAEDLLRWRPALLLHHVRDLERQLETWRLSAEV